MILLSTMAMPVSFYANANGYDEQQVAHWRGHGKDKMQHLVRKLNLNVEQQVKIKAIVQQQKANGEANRETMRAFRDQMESLLSAAIFNDDAFTSLHNQYQPQLAEAALQRAKTHHAILQVLDASQQEKFKRMKQRGKTLFH